MLNSSEKPMQSSGLYKFLPKQVVFGFLIMAINIFASCSSAQVLEGQLTNRLIVNGNADPLFSQPSNTVYIYNCYLFERLTALNQKQEIELAGRIDDAKAKLKKSEISISTIGYVLTDLKKNFCWQYDTTQTSPKIVKQFAANEKYLGILLKGDPISQLGGDPNAMKYVKDTVFAAKKYKIYEQATDGPKDLQGHKLIKIRAYADQTVKNHYYHISKTMDDKYGGYIDSFDCIYEAGTVNRYERRFDQGLTANERKMIEKYIRLAKKDMKTDTVK